MSILLKNGYVVTQNRKRDILETDVLIENERISKIGQIKDADEVIDCSGCAVLPGLINTHTHVANTLLRGCADDMPLEEMLEVTFRVDDQLTRRDVQIGAMLGCLEMLRSGTTSFLDLFYWEDEVARAVRQSGIRGFLAWVILDEEFTTQKGSPLKNCERFIQNHRGERRITPMAGFQGVYVCSEETLLAGRELAEREKVRSHMHLSETRKEVYDHLRKSGKRPPEWLSDIGFLHQNLSVAHGVWLTINEIRLLAREGVSIAHCPTSNMKLASGGVAPLPEMFNEKMVVALGTDSPISNNCMDMFLEMKVCAILHKSHRWDARVVPAQKALDMATIDAARLLGVADELGSIEEGKLADLIVVDLRTPNMLPVSERNLVSNLVYSCTGANVRTTIVDGRVVMSEGEIVGVDEKSVIERVQTAASELFGG